MRSRTLLPITVLTALLLPLGSISLADTAKAPVPIPRPAVSDALAVAVPQPRPSVPAPQRPDAGALPAEEIACRARLRRFGARFSAAEPVSGAAGCGIAHPVAISGLPGGIAVSRDVVVNCPTALALAQWTGTADAAARQIYESGLSRIEVFSAYDCRRRNSQSHAQLSEHATGNAVDIGRFELIDGAVIDVGFAAATEEQRHRFLDTVREAGCRHFTTVLGPGTDSFHEDHFHFDLAERPRGYRYCR